MSDITIANMYFAEKDPGGKVGFIPLGPLYLTSVLERNGFEVDFRDYLVGGAKYGDPADCVNILSFLDDPADVLAVGCSSCTLPVVLPALEKLKRCYPRKTFILGGIGPTGVAEKVLKNFPFIDIVVRGEAERTVVELMYRLEAGKGLENVRGIGYRRGGNAVHINPDRERIRNLDELPFPAYHRVDMNAYTCTGLISARGCPFRCIFCDVAPFWGRNQYYNRSIKNVIEEIRLLKEEYKQEVITLFDETFPVSRERVLEFCKRLKNEKLGIRWTCSARISPMDGELIKAMSKAGCMMVFYGVESGSGRVLKQTKKGYNKRQVEKIIRESLEYMAVNAFFMWGFPFETMADFYETLDYVDHVSRLGVAPVVHIVNTLPLSQLYSRYKEDLTFSRKLYENSLLLRHEEILRLIETYPRIFPGFYHCDKNILLKYEIARKRGMANNLITLDSLGQEYASYRGPGKKGS